MYSAVVNFKFVQRSPQEILDTLTCDELVIVKSHLKTSIKPDIRKQIIPVLMSKTIVGEESNEIITTKQEGTEASTVLVLEKANAFERKFEFEILKLQ